ncbi:MAG TPA: flippase-like domain-containing protein [Stellaceae bacterium]|nr:flippase-like domain-containing protein [Stellaceae bacterium]
MKMLRLATILGLGGFALLTGLLLYEGVGSVFEALSMGGFGLIWASLCHVVPMAVNAHAWRVLFVGNGRPSLSRATWIIWVREAVNGLLPVARIGGEVISVRLATRAGFNTAPVVASLIADITLSMISQFLFTLLGLVLLLMRIDDTAAAYRVAGGLLIAIPMVGGLIAVQRYGIVNIGEKLVRSLFGERLADVVGNAVRLDRVLKLIYRRRSRVVASTLWQLVGWLAGTAEIYFALMALGHPVGLAEAVILESLAQAVSSAAFMVPGGMGVQEGGFLLFGTLLGLGPDVALALALARRIRDLVVFVPALILWQIGEAQKLAMGGGSAHKPLAR